MHRFQAYAIATGVLSVALSLSAAAFSAVVSFVSWTDFKDVLGGIAGFCVFVVSIAAFVQLRPVKAMLRYLFVAPVTKWHHASLDDWAEVSPRLNRIDERIDGLERAVCHHSK